MKGKLYVVATPIGNLDDITARAVHVLSTVDLIAAEDTRNTLTLLNKLNIKTKLVSNHKFNENSKVKTFIDKLSSGQSIALVSDAGTPCISDPGHVLVSRAAEENIEVIGVCGPCAAATAVSVSGFDARSFVYLGFLPREHSKIRSVLQIFDTPIKPLVVFYESPRRIINSLEVIAESFPHTQLCLCNDLTKKFERIYRGAPQEVVEELRDNPDHQKGEYTCVIENRETSVSPPDAPPFSLEAQLVDIMLRSGSSLKSAVQTLFAAQKEVSKKEIYSASLRLKEFIRDASQN